MQSSWGSHDCHEFAAIKESGVGLQVTMRAYGLVAGWQYELKYTQFGVWKEYPMHWFIQREWARLAKEGGVKRVGCVLLVLMSKW